MTFMSKERRREIQYGFKGLTGKQENVNPAVQEKGKIMSSVLDKRDPRHLKRCPLDRPQERDLGFLCRLGSDHRRDEK